MSSRPHSIRDVFITVAGAYVPGEPADNDRIEDVLGYRNAQPSYSTGDASRE